MDIVPARRLRSISGLEPQSVEGIFHVTLTAHGNAFGPIRAAPLKCGVRNPLYHGLASHVSEIVGDKHAGERQRATIGVDEDEYS